jgi:hypothetical protein
MTAYGVRFQPVIRGAKRNPPKRVPDVDLHENYYEAFLRRIQPSKPSAEPNSQAEAGTGTAAAGENTAYVLFWMGE